MRGLVVQGGGSFGDATAGRLYAQRPSYDLTIGDSTGALIAVLASAQQWESLKEGYTRTENSMVWKRNPLKKNGNPSALRVIQAIIQGKTGLGDITSLEGRIRHLFTEEDFLRLKTKLIKEGKDAVVVVCRIDSHSKITEYHSIKDHSYSNFVKYMVASCAFPILAEPIEIEGKLYVDGGVSESVPLRYAIEHGCKEVDVFLHRTKKSGAKKPVKNILHMALRTIETMMEAGIEDELISVIEKYGSEVLIRVHYLDQEIDHPQMLFNSWDMSPVFDRYFNKYR